MPIVVAVVNQKGGVGKTTTAVNLAASLGVAEQRTLLIDLDPQANATSGAGIEPHPERNTYGVLLGQTSLDEALAATPVPYFNAVPSTPDLIGFEVEGLELDRREYALKDALARIQQPFDVIIIDCPPSLGLLTLNALTAADIVLVPLQAEYYALEGLSRLMSTLELVQENLNPSLLLEGIVLTMFDVRNNLAHQVLKEVQGHFPNELYQTKVPRNVRLSEAPSFGKPIVTYDIRSVGAQAYLQLAQEFIKRNEARLTPRGVVHDRQDREKSVGTRDLVAHSPKAPASHL